MSQQEQTSLGRRGERIFIAVLIVFSAAALWQAWLIAGFSKLSSPGVFPMLAATIMLISALFAFRGKKPGAVDAGDNDTTAAGNMPVLPARVALMATMLILYILAMPLLGFLLDSGLFLLASFCYLWKKPLWMSLITTALSLIVIHLLFRVVFQVILPAGTLLDVFR